MSTSSLVIDRNMDIPTQMSPLTLNQYGETTAIADASTPVSFSSTGGSGVVTIPPDARFVRIHPTGSNNARVTFTRADTSPAATSANSIQVVAGLPEWFGLPLTADRSFQVGAAAACPVTVSFGW